MDGDGDAPLSTNVLAALKRKRGTLKKRLTDFKKYIEAKDKLFSTNNVLERMVIIELECRLTRIMPVLDEIQEVDNSIKDIAEDDTDDLESFEANYYTVIATAKLLLEKVSVSETSVTAEASSAVSNHNAEINNVKLPTIQLPKFNGKFTNWLEFRDTYTALIHSCEKLSDVQKFYYLKASLEGDAAKIISSMETSANNYQTAWSLLCERYENKRLLVHNHMRALFNMPSVARESATQLREILDNITQHLRALKMLNQPIEHWDAFIIFIVTSKFDSLTAREWEMDHESRDIPSLSDMKAFLRKKVEMLETLNFTKENASFSNQNKAKPAAKTFLGANNNFSCYFCQGKHTIYNCKEFTALSMDVRKKQILAKNLCLNCLRPGHLVKDCTSRGCKTCQMKHNSLLHFEKSEKQLSLKEVEAVNDKASAAASYLVNGSTPVYAILSTALVRVKDTTFRALLDTGSQSNLLTKTAATEIGVKISPVKSSIMGLGDHELRVRGRCQIFIQSEINSFGTRIDCLVVDNISSNFSQTGLSKFRNDIPEELTLADPKFDEIGRLDILIGNGVFWTLMSDGNRKLGEGKPVLQNTSLGWILAGPLLVLPPLRHKPRCHLSKENDIQSQLTKFWEIEECPKKKIESKENQACEEHFKCNHQRDDEGRFTVSIPFKKPLSLLGESKIGATKRFYNLEHKLQMQPQVKQQYAEFMEEYIKLNHMSEVTRNNFDETEFEYYIPHHCVINDASVTTKLRVVFDASFATTTGHSLNNLQHIGPTIQSDLFGILLRFREHAIAISADITKMYRQVLVNPEERSLQKIFWRSDPSKSLAVYTLNTVTYGMTSASYLAIRCLHQLAIENNNKFPEACKIIMDNFYVDDLLSGTDDREKASLLCEQISNILKQGCFPLRKWLSNVPEILKGVKDDNDKHSVLSIGEHERTKTLGLYWTPTSDVLGFKVNAGDKRPITKRTILSTISQIFDPLGLLGACIIKTKILLQVLWQEKLDWDDDVPYQIQKNWNEFQDELICLNELSIPRKVICSHMINLELHGYSDASERAYGACIYLRSEDETGQVSSYLLCSKAKVAPLKTLTIPRLELCAALLLAKLANKVLESLTKEIGSVNLWCDSQIILAWLHTPPNTLKIFVANRVVQISELVPNALWRYVPTESNPADLISRGLSPKILISTKMWWEGPSWLLNQRDRWPEQPSVVIKELPETRSEKPLCLKSSITDNTLITRFSDFYKLIRILSICIRFAENCRRKRNERKRGIITVAEYSNTFNNLVKLAQAESFAQELNDLTVHGRVRKQSSLASLTPFLDKNGLMRITGRIQFSELLYDERHPIILSSKHHLTYLILLDIHTTQMHAGVQQMICSAREKFWPVNVRNLAKRIVRECMVCFRVNPPNKTPIMGNLPRDRVNRAFPFQNVGIDYAGPFTIKNKKGRGAKTSKCYMALFVCFVVKAIHIEIVSDLSTEAFIAALRRFTARRGRPSNIFSDNATNFVGADKQLRLWLETINEEKVMDVCATEGITWHFIPPRAPNFGGLWESCIKRAKFHLTRVLLNSILTFEELYTVCCQVEAILNSRPITPLTDHPTDLLPLTPSHFLIGRKLTSIPTPDLTSINAARLPCFQRVQQLTQGFWKRWYHEYLQQLNPRGKWRSSDTPPVAVGDLVLVQESGQPPLVWPLGRVMDVHPGPDKVVRVASVQTTKGVYKRAVTKLYPLPKQETTANED